MTHEQKIVEWFLWLRKRNWLLKQIADLEKAKKEYYGV